MDIKSVIASVLVAAIVAGGVTVVAKPEVAQNTLGALTSPDVNSYLNVNGVFSSGGAIFASSTGDTTQTLAASDMADYSVLALTPTTGNTTYTLPATTSFPGIPDAGDVREWVIQNASSTSGITATIAAGTGIDLQEPDGQNVVISDTNFAWLTCFRKANTDIVCRVDETIPAD